MNKYKMVNLIYVRVFLFGSVSLSAEWIDRYKHGESILKLSVPVFVMSSGEILAVV